MCTADSACNAAGLGFSGYSKLGYAQWDLVTGVDVIAIEVRIFQISNDYIVYCSSSIVWIKFTVNGEWVEHHHKYLVTQVNCFIVKFASFSCSFVLVYSDKAVDICSLLVSMCFYNSYRICYERVKFVNPVFATFFMSAWWHGFYPGYYFLFVMTSLDLMASRKVTC